ncbi:MAG: class I SAM-dependent RNA methyltransferase, partial [Limisphaerales bacterium]
DIAFGGEGVGRVNDFVIFVPFVLLGERVEVEISEVKKNFARAKLLRVEKSSPQRVQPPCVYFGKCGGCQYQHVEYAMQLELKWKQIADLFERVGKISSDKIAPVIPCPQPYGYRNRIMIRSQWNKPEQKLNIGFVRWDCGLVEDIEECKIAEPAISEQIKSVRANPPPKGGIKIVLRIPPENWDVPPDSFFQNNFFLLPKLVETVREFLGGTGVAPVSKINFEQSEIGEPPAPLKHLIDLYCGVGFFGIELADLVESFVGVEYDRRAIQSARKNAAARKIENGEFVSAKVEDILPQLLKRWDETTGELRDKNSSDSRGRSLHQNEITVLLDPPRKGCSPETLNLLRETRPVQIIYVSCHPATMARDLNILCADGVFELARVQPLDMFPQTQHVECVAGLRGGLALPRRPKYTQINKSNGRKSN